MLKLSKQKSTLTGTSEYSLTIKLGSFGLGIATTSTAILLFWLLRWALS